MISLIYGKRYAMNMCPRQVALTLTCLMAADCAGSLGIPSDAFYNWRREHPLQNERGQLQFRRLLHLSKASLNRLGGLFELDPDHWVLVLCVSRKAGLKWEMIARHELRRINAILGWDITHSYLGAWPHTLPGLSFLLSGIFILYPKT